MNSGAVKEGPGKVRIKAISGQGICGADFPMKVSSLGEARVLGFSSDLRPPSGIPNGAAQPRWPVNDPYRSAATTAYPSASPQSSMSAGASSPLALDPRGARPSLGPSQAPQLVTAGPVSVTPAATLACPVISVLDQWITETVQPAALRWFNQPVVEIKQISAYSCRGMNGNPNARISEHAFGNALDIAAFTLADGTKITVKGGWNGLPEEQGFLRDVQAGACEDFTTVLAPGSNAYHYDHIHVDLMRRRNGYRACNPHKTSGEVVAAKARARYGARGQPSVTGSVAPRRLSAPSARIAPHAFADEPRKRKLPFAVPGNDGED